MDFVTICMCGIALEYITRYSIEGLNESVKINTLLRLFLLLLFNAAFAAFFYSMSIQVRGAYKTLLWKRDPCGFSQSFRLCYQTEQPLNQVGRIGSCLYGKLRCILLISKGLHFIRSGSLPNKLIYTASLRYVMGFPHRVLLRNLRQLLHNWRHAILNIRRKSSPDHLSGLKNTE